MAEVRKFDKGLDAKVQSQFQPVFDMDGKRIVMSGAFKARMMAQMDKAVSRYAKARMKNMPMKGGM